MKRGSMTKRIPDDHKEIINTHPYFKKCFRWMEGNCDGRVTIDHALTYAGKRINELFAYVPVCEYHHGLLGPGGLNKRMNEQEALRRATKEDLAKYPKATWRK